MTESVKRVREALRGIAVDGWCSETQTEEIIAALTEAIAERLEIRNVNHGADIQCITQEIHAKQIR
jgi:hypothetical protein